jgi:prepilin peptidase CpaA
MTIPATLHLSHTAAIPVLAFVAFTAAVELRSRRMPGGLVLLAVVAAAAYHGRVSGPVAVVGVIAGTLVAGLLLLPTWLSGWTGARDLALMAAIGAWLGPVPCAWAVGVALVTGGLIALVTAVRRGLMPASWWGAASLAAWAVTTRGRAALPQAPVSEPRLPFALAVFVGACAALAWNA